MQVEASTRLLEGIKRVQRRLMLLRVMKVTIIGIISGSAAALLVLLLSRLVPLLYAREIALALFLLSPLVATIVAFVQRVGVAETARTIDRKAEDAVGTALGLMHSDSFVAALQREDAAEAVERYASSMNEHLPFLKKLDKRKKLGMYGVLIIWLTAAILWLSPGEMDKKAELIAQAKTELASLEAKIGEVENKLEAEQISEEAKRNLLEPLEKLKEQIAKLDDPQLAQQMLEQAQRELEKLAALGEDQAQRLQAVASELQKEPQLRKLGEALENRDSGKAQASIDDMRSTLKQLSDEEREQLAEALERVAELASSSSDELAEALKQAAEQARDNSESQSGVGSHDDATDGADDALAALGEALAGGLSDEAAAALAQMLASQLAGAATSGESPVGTGGALAESGSSLEGAGSPSTTGTGQGGATTGQGSGSSGTSGSSGSAGEAGEGSSSQGGGTSSGTGSSATEGSGGSGQGSGTGAGTGSGNGTGAGSGSSGAGSGGGKGGQGAGNGLGNRNLVTTPRIHEGAGNVQQDGGPITGGQMETGGKSPMIDGVTRPYTEVYAEYSTEAKQALGRNQLPQSMQQRVRDYFEDIQPNR